MITLYHAPESRSTRMFWLLEEIGQPYEIRPVSIFRPRTGEGQPDPANPHPDKRVPAIVHEGRLVAESVAIVLYLTEAFPEAGLAPSPGSAQRGDYLTWAAWYAAELEPAIIATMMGELETSPQKQRSKEAAVARIRNALARHPYMLGDQFSAIDLLVGSALEFAGPQFMSGDDIDAYRERWTTRPAAVRSKDLDHASGVQGRQEVKELVGA